MNIIIKANDKLEKIFVAYRTDKISKIFFKKAYEHLKKSLISLQSKNYAFFKMKNLAIKSAKIYKILLYSMLSEVLNMIELFCYLKFSLKRYLIIWKC